MTWRQKLSTHLSASVFQSVPYFPWLRSWRPNGRREERSLSCQPAPLGLSALSHRSLFPTTAVWTPPDWDSLGSKVGQRIPVQSCCGCTGLGLTGGGSDETDAGGKEHASTSSLVSSEGDGVSASSGDGVSASSGCAGDVCTGESASVVVGEGSTPDSGSTVTQGRP